MTKKGLQATTRPIPIDALTEAKCEESGKELNKNQTAADTNHEIFVVVQIVQKRVVASLMRL